MTATQTVTLGSRTYTFTTEGATTRAALQTLGSLFNSRGEFFGYVTEYQGRRQVLSTSKVRCNLPEERAALAALTA